MESEKNTELVWYKNVSYEEKIELAKEKLSNMVGSFVEAGYWIRSIWEDEECRKHGYATIWDMAEAEFGLKKSEASRAVSMNKKYSVGGNSPILLEKYSMYSKSQLQEMLTIKSEELEQKVTADMTVEEIRHLKKTGATPEELEMLREVLAAYTQTEYVDILYVTGEADGDISESIKEKLDFDVPVKRGNEVFFTGDDKDELVDRVTGEVLATYAPEVAVGMILDEFRKLQEVREIKRKPGVKGLCDDACCSECGEYLNEPAPGLEVDYICPRCGQAVDWSDYEGYKTVSEQANTETEKEVREEAVATSQQPVNTESNVLLETEIIEEIDAEEEEIVEYMEFEKLEDEEGEELTIIDGEFREIPVETELSAYGYKPTEYPEGSSLSTKGCGHKYTCFDCAQECGIRQESRNCREATLGNPYSCTTMNVMELLEVEMGEMCQFINHEIAHHTAGSNEPIPCCKLCQVRTCGYRCGKSAHMVIDEKDTPKVEATPLAAEEETEIVKVKKILEREKALLNDYMEIEDLPETTLVRQKIIVGALANMLCELEEAAEEENTEQPELTILKNNEQRKDFIDGYNNWPVWIEQPLTRERYYRYEFENGTAFIVRAYYHKCFDVTSSYSKKWEDRYKDDWGAEEYYIVTEGKYFKDCLTNKSAMIEFLKNLQKGDK